MRQHSSLVKTGRAKGLRWSEAIPVMGLSALLTVVLAVRVLADPVVYPTGTCGEAKNCQTGDMGNGKTCVQYLSYPSGTPNTGLNDWAELNIECGVEFNNFPWWPTGNRCGGSAYTTDPICP
jgi:hypothetical protein